MSFLSKLWKGIKKGVKKVAKGIKKVAKKVWKGVKKFAKSKIGKIIIAAAAIYITGGMAGAWASPTWLGGSGFAAAGTTTSTLGSGLTMTTATGGGGLMPSAAAVTSAEGLAAGGFGAAEAASAAIEGTLATSGAAQMPSLAAVTSDAGQVAGGLPQAVEASQAVEGSSGLMSQLADYGGEAMQYASDNPLLVQAAGKGLSAAMADDPYELWRKKQEYLNENSVSNIAGINADGTGTRIRTFGAQQEDIADQQWSPTYAADPSRMGAV